MPRFFPSALIKTGARVRVTLAAALLAMAGAVVSDAQIPSPSPSPSNKPKQAYVRVWNVLPHPPPTILEVLVGDKSLSIAAPCNFYAGYAAVAPGPTTFKVRKAGEKDSSPKLVPTNLLADMYITMLAVDKGGQPNIELINDTIVPPKDPNAPVTGRLVVRQLFPNARVTVSLGAAAPGAPMNYGETAVLDDLPVTQNTINIQAVFPGQSPKTTSLPLDLTQYHHNTLLIYPDPYGRFRPRLAIDGQTVAEQGGRPGDTR